MHPEVVDNEAGKCPICGMTLEPVRLALVWTCPVHTETTEAQPGRCRRCGRDLIRVTKALSFTCRAHPAVNVLDPGRCPRCGRTLVARRVSLERSAVAQMARALIEAASWVGCDNVVIEVVDPPELARPLRAAVAAT